MATFFSPACAGDCLQASDGCPTFSAQESWEEVPEGCSRWGCHQTAARAHNCTLYGWVYGSATCRHALCLKRPQHRYKSSMNALSSAQLSPAEPLAWVALHTVEPNTALRLACSHTPAIAEVCPTRHRAQSCTWIPPLSYSPTQLFLLHRCSPVACGRDFHSLSYMSHEEMSPFVSFESCT